MKLLTDSSALSQVGVGLRQRMLDDGYVYLPKFMARDANAVLQDDAWGRLVAGLSRKTDRVGANPPFRSFGFGSAYDEIQKSEAFHRFAHNPELLALVERLCSGPVFCHPAKVARVSFPTEPGEVFSLPPHQDAAALGPRAEVLTVWIALTFCEASQGLWILPRSHREGFLPPERLPGRSRALYLTDVSDDPSWASADFETGDVVVFHALTVHAGGPNRTDRVRLSVDYRYQSPTDPISRQFLEPHGWPITAPWDVLTAGWSTRAWIRAPATVRVIDAPEKAQHLDDAD